MTKIVVKIEHHKNHMLWWVWSRIIKSKYLNRWMLIRKTHVISSLNYQNFCIITTINLKLEMTICVIHNCQLEFKDNSLIQNGWSVSWKSPWQLESLHTYNELCEGGEDIGVAKVYHTMCGLSYREHLHPRWHLWPIHVAIADCHFRLSNLNTRGLQAIGDDSPRGVSDMLE